ncbi:MAG TPA: hypothetical protein VK680_04165 [Solirubrobacteraceae bacterium]|nr:hypothetical protein [Solirubrobacteraceae bacterium]
MTAGAWLTRRGPLCGHGHRGDGQAILVHDVKVSLDRLLGVGAGFLDRLATLGSSGTNTLKPPSASATITTLSS